jgi:hypothetical protein
MDRMNLLPKGSVFRRITLRSVLLAMRGSPYVVMSYVCWDISPVGSGIGMFPLASIGDEEITTRLGLHQSRWSVSV